MNSIWYNKIQLQVEERMENLHKKDFKFYRVDYFLSLAQKVDELSSSCIECKMLKQKIENTTNNLDTLLSGEIALRKEYELKLDEIEKHVRKVHGVYPKQYFLYLYTFVGVLTGIVLGFLISKITNFVDIKAGLIFGFTIGLIFGRVWGHYKEKNSVTI